MQLALLALFLVVAVLLVVRASNRDRRDYGRFKTLTDTKDRQRVFAKWLRDSFLVNGGLAVAVLIASWSFIPSAMASARGWTPLNSLSSFFSGGTGVGFAIGASVAFVGLLIAPVFLFRAQLSDAPALGDIGSLLPRTPGELPYGILLSLNAGLVEELLFRLGMPALLYGITGNGIVSFAIASVLFGLLHLYQKLPGILGATLLGVAFSLLYLLTRSIVVVIIVHALIDLRSLALIPLARGVLKSKPAVAEADEVATDSK